METSFYFRITYLYNLKAAIYNLCILPTYVHYAAET